MDSTGQVKGRAKVGDQEASVEGEYLDEEGIASRNEINPKLSWPAAQGPMMGGCSADPTGAETINGVDGLRMVWRCEETYIRRGMGNVSPLMVDLASPWLLGRRSDTLKLS